MKIIDKKNNDILFGIALFVTTFNKRGMRQVRVSSFDTVCFTFYTQDPKNNILCKYERGAYYGILKQDHADFCVLNNADLCKLEDGMLRYTFRYEYFTSNPQIKDCKYNFQFEKETHLFLKTSKKYKHDCH